VSLSVSDSVSTSFGRMIGYVRKVTFLVTTVRNWILRLRLRIIQLIIITLPSLKYDLYSL
jgi:hypothetical protein